MHCLSNFHTAFIHSPLLLLIDGKGNHESESMGCFRLALISLKTEQTIVSRLRIWVIYMGAHHVWLNVTTELLAIKRDPLAARVACTCRGIPYPMLFYYWLPKPCLCPHQTRSLTSVSPPQSRKGKNFGGKKIWISTYRENKQIIHSISWSLKVQFSLVNK